jgi:hypothetical protein
MYDMRGSWQDVDIVSIRKQLCIFCNVVTFRDQFGSGPLVDPRPI